MTKQIQLTKNKFALVDDEDFEYFNQYNWCTQGEYAARWKSRRKGENGGSQCFYMHREIVGMGDKNGGEEVDHINGDKLDNRKINLRICTSQENSRNTKKRTNATSKYKGVNKSAKGWQVFIWLDGKNKHIGLFSNDKEIEAACAYDEVAKKYYGKFAKLNFLES